MAEILRMGQIPPIHVQRLQTDAVLEHSIYALRFGHVERGDIQNDQFRAVFKHPVHDGGSICQKGTVPLNALQFRVSLEHRATVRRRRHAALSADEQAVISGVFLDPCQDFAVLLSPVRVGGYIPAVRAFRRRVFQRVHYRQGTNLLPRIEGMEHRIVFRLFRFLVLGFGRLERVFHQKVHSGRRRKNANHHDDDDSQRDQRRDAGKDFPVERARRGRRVHRGRQFYLATYQQVSTAPRTGFRFKRAFRAAYFALPLTRVVTTRFLLHT